MKPGNPDRYDRKGAKSCRTIVLGDKCGFKPLFLERGVF